MLRRAVARKHLARNPFLDGQGKLVDNLKPLKAPPGRVRFLSLEEIDTLMAACADKPYLRAFVLVALNTGARRNEILSFTRQSIDVQNRIATIVDTKNGEIGHVPLNGTAFEALTSLPTRLDGRLFPFKPNQISVQFGRVCRRAGIVDFRLHDLRHTFASYQAMRGEQGRAIQELLRHKDPRMTTRYSHLSNAHLKAAVNAVNLGVSSPATKTDAAG